MSYQPEELQLSNATLSVTLHANGTLTVLDKRTGQTWHQRALVQVQTIARTADGIETVYAQRAEGLKLGLSLQLDVQRPEFTLTLTGEGPLNEPLRFPHPFTSPAETYLVVPMNEGISYPADDDAIPPRRLVAYGGHGICMAFWGVTDGERGYMAIIETADDAAIRIDRAYGLLYIAPEWDAQKGQFGYARRLRYIFFDRGGHVAICKRYRAHARQMGLLKTLAEKRERLPAVDLLLGAVNVWCWEKPALSIVEEMRRAGIERILWSAAAPPGDIRTMNDLGVLTSRYDIYQDVMDPAIFPKLHSVHPDWPTEAWPDDLMLDAKGDWIRGWQVKGTDGVMYPCGVLCDRKAPDYARRRISQEIKTHPYRCRFIDTTTATPWRECYHPQHPLTRSESRAWKMELLRLVNQEMGLVTGSETGHDAAVPYVHYFEGMLSLAPYRVPDAGRNMLQIWDEVPERVATFQVGHKYRLPLWELVYHDCVLAHWYWGDYSNKLPALWDKRDLFNLLYGTVPMFMFNRDTWTKYRERFVQSYRNVCPVAREVGYAEMTDHRFLTPDRAVQQTIFSNDVAVTCNFSSEPYPLGRGKMLAPLGFHVVGI